MTAPLTDLLAVLRGSSPAPVSNFLSFAGGLHLQDINNIATALSGSSFTGGLRLKGMQVLATLYCWACTAATDTAFSGCTLNDSGAELLADALGQNQVLSTLELPGD